MADMFGAPIGIRQAEADQRADIAGNLGAIKTLGEIEAQPVEMELKRAHSRYYNANALKDEMAAQEMRTWADLAKGVTQGGEGGVPADPASQLDALASAGIRSGFVAKGAELAIKAANIRARDAAAGASAAAEQVRKVNAARRGFETVSSLAQGALEVGTQEGYDMLRMQATQMAQSGALPPGVDVTRLPESYEDAKPVLQQLVSQGIKTIDQLKLREEQLTGAARRGALGAQAGAANARRELINARIPMAKLDYTEALKNGGRFSVQAQERKQVLTELGRAKLRADEEKLYPPAPPNPADRKLGQKYTAADGSKFLWSTDPKTGKPVGMLLAVPKTPQRGAAAEATDLEDDELDGEE